MTVVFVVLTAAISLAWSHTKLMSQDEMYAFQTDSVPSFARLIEVQRKWPISLDPLLVHGLSHGAMQVFGAGAFALRLPAFAGFLLMQVCLFFLVRSLAGERAGMVAAAFPAMTATSFYAAEGRPYGVLLGLYALAVWCWSAAARLDSGGSASTSQERDAGHREHSRAWALVGLAGAIAGTMNAHYFGVLLLLPVCAAEGYRTLERRRVDWPMVAAICAGTASFVGTLPFVHGAGEFKKHYYNGGTISLHDITRAYRSIFVDYTQMSLRVQHVVMAGLVVFAVALVWGCWRAGARTARAAAGPSHDGETVMHEARVPAAHISRAEWVMLLVLAALPFFGYLLAKYVTHSIEVRYVLGALVALSAMVAIATSEWLENDRIFQAVVALLLAAVAMGGVVRVRAEQRTTAETMASLVLPADVKTRLAALPDDALYLQDMGRFEVASYYEPDPDMRTRMTLVFSTAQELRWNRHDTMALTAMHLAQFTDLHVVDYDALRRMPADHAFVLYHTGWDWTDEAFAADHAQVQALGQALAGDAVIVRLSE